MTDIAFTIDITASIEIKLIFDNVSDKINAIANAINNDTSTWREPYTIHPFMEMEAGTKRYTRLE